MKNKINLIKYQKNIYTFIKNSIGLISSSLWEDPGFVMVEAAASNTFVISSDCPCGPKEFVGNNSGLLFKNNNLNSLEENILKYLAMESDQIRKYKVNAKRKSINFTKLRHYNILVNYLKK